MACQTCGAVLAGGSAFCNFCGSPVTVVAPSPVSVQVGGATAQRRVTSVLFADLVAFTTLAELRDSEDVRSMLTEYFDVCATIVRRYGGTVEKFIGDAVMAVWGVPTSHEDDAERAVRAGLELVNGVATLGERLDLPQLALRVGIVTGEVTATLSATDQAMVAGDPVNTAARVQSAAGAGEVWVDTTTRTLTAAAVTYFDAGRHALKGKAEPVQLFRAGAVVAARGGSQRVDGLEAALVGRERQLRLLKEFFHATQESGGASVVVLDGEAGFGKSRLGWELEKYVDGLEASVAWHRGRCLSYGDGVAFWALSEAVRARLGLLEDDPTAVVLAALDSKLGELVPDQTERAWLRPRVASLLGAESREYAREDLFAAWSAFLERVGAGDPVVLLIDDAHHADQGMLDFVEHVAANARFTLFVLMLARPELLERNPTLGGRRASVLRLEPLPDQALAELVGNLVSGLDDASVDSLVRRSEGIPLFAVETVRALIDRGVISPQDGRYAVTPGQVVDLDQLGAPASLHALVAARLDALSVPERGVMSDASVLGESFTREAIGILARGVADLDSVLAGLQRREFLATDQDPFSAERGQFRFVHSVVRQVAYATLARSDRKARHLLVAEHLMSDSERLDELAPVVARHLLDAAEVSAPDDPAVVALRDRASQLLVTAGVRACSLGSYADGLRVFRSAAEIIDDDQALAAVLSRAALAAVRVYQYDAALADAERAIALYDEAGDARGAADAAYSLAKALGELGRHDEAVAVAEQRLASIVELVGAELLVGRLSRVLGEYLQFQGLFREAAPYVDDALRMADLTGDAETLAAALNLLAAEQLLLGSVHVAHLLYAGMAEVSRKSELWNPLTMALGNEACLLASQDLDRAIDLMRQGVANQADHGLPRHLSIESNLTLWYWLSGRWEELDALLLDVAPETLGNSLVARKAAGTDLLVVWAGTREERLVDRFPSEQDALVPGLAIHEKYRQVGIALASGREADAAALGAELVDAEIQLNGLADDLHALWSIAVRAAVAADDPGALRGLTERLVVYPDQALPLALRGQRRIAQGLAETYAESPDDEAVVAALEAGIAELAEAGSLVWEAHAHEDLGLWHLSKGREAEAGPLINVARATYERLGAQRWLASLDAARSSRTRRPVSSPGSGSSSLED
jgi:class 3 adenylate cyclase/tetratricopeptide (TPR) repeat protein